MRLPPAMTRAIAALLAALLLAPATALAADGESTPLNLKPPKAGASEAVGQSSGGGLVRTFVGLAIVIAVIYGVYWVLKQVKASREERASGSGLSTIATLPLGPNRSLHLIRAGGEVLVVGASEQGVNHIRTYSEEEARVQGLLDLELEAKEISSRPKPRLGLPSSLKAPDGKTAVELIRSWTVRG